MRKAFVVAIDGPAGSGKSTIAHLLAKKLGYIYIDTGAMYRALTLKAIRRNVDLNDNKSLIKLASKTDIVLRSQKNGSLKIFLDSEDVTKKIRNPQVTNKVSRVANIVPIRSIMVKKQREFAKLGSVVVEGRDITTIVFPDADKKFYLDASFDERLKRRHKQLIKQLQKISKRKLLDDLKARDKKDRERKVGALKITKDAIYVDTTNLTIAQVRKKLLSEIK